MSVRKSLAWSYGAQGLIFFVTFGSSVIAARILGPYEMGIFAVAMATAGVLSILSEFGVGPYLIRHEAPDKNTKAAVFTVNLILNAIVSIGIVSIAAFGPLFDLNASIRQILLLTAVTPLIASFEMLPSTFMQRDMNFKTLALINVGRAIFNSAIVVVLALEGLGALSPAIAMVVTAVGSAIAFNVLGRTHVSFRLGLSGWRDIARFGFQMMSIGGIAGLAQRLSELIIGRMLGLAALGIYGRAASLSNQLWMNVYGLATRVIFAKMATEMRDTQTVSKTFLSGISMITAVVWPLLLGIAILSPPIIHALYGQQWSGAALPLSILMGVQLITLGFGMNWELCVLTGRTGWQARVEAVRAVVGLTAVTAGSFFSLPAATFGRMVEAISGLILFGPKMRSMAGTEPGQISGVYKASTMLTLVAVLPCLMLMIGTDWSSGTSWWLIGPAILLGILIWCWLLRSTGHPLFIEFERVAPKLRKLWIRN